VNIEAQILPFMGALEEAGLLGANAFQYGGPDKMVMLSGGPPSHLARHSILCGPSTTRLVVRQPPVEPATAHRPSKGEIQLTNPASKLVGHIEEWKHGCWYHATSIFDETLSGLLAKLKDVSDPTCFVPTPDERLPQRSFWAGALAYDLVQWTQPIALQHPPQDGSVLAVLWRVERFVCEQKTTNTMEVFGRKEDPWVKQAEGILSQSFQWHAPETKENPHPESTNMNDDEHERGIEAIKEGIAAGEFYQVNLGRWWSGRLSQHPQAIFEHLCASNPAPFSAYMEAEDLNLALVSSSPESLLQSDGMHLRTAPIKGTRPRGATPEQEKKLRDEMINDEKERAEHRMLVDLMRNDLGQVSAVGKVSIERFDVEAYANVQHLVSQVVGELAEGKTSLDAIQAVFPGGSITGCPRTVVCAAIDELEQRPRSFWTGSIGWIDVHSGSCAWNILIRTLIATRERKQWHGAIAAGGGITIGSSAKAEVEEAKWKAAALRRACGWKPEQRAQLPTGTLEIQPLPVEEAPVAQKKGSIQMNDESLHLDECVLLIDNLDSFTQNIAHAVAGLGRTVVVHQSRSSNHASASVMDTMNDLIARLKPTHIILGPGPGQPKESPLTMHIATSAIEGSLDVAVMGICLGHQALGVASGMELLQVPSGPVHGSPRSIHHTGTGVFAGIESPQSFSLYNSLIVSNQGHSMWKETAWNQTTQDLMGIQHQSRPIVGVQFHPESVGSRNGIKVLDNFLKMRADA
jgi:anthranilate synthase